MPLKRKIETSSTLRGIASSSYFMKKEGKQRRYVKYWELRANVLRSNLFEADYNSVSSSCPLSGKDILIECSHKSFLRIVVGKQSLITSTMLNVPNWIKTNINQILRSIFHFYHILIIHEYRIAWGAFLLIWKCC